MTNDIKRDNATHDDAAHDNATDASIHNFIAKVRFNGDGLVPAIAVDKDDKKVKMLAFMNKQSLYHTLSTKQVCYYSRSRQALWVKGATSGNTQYLHDCFLDCDGDTILCVITQKGPACHTGADDCFITKFVP